MVFRAVMSKLTAVWSPIFIAGLSPVLLTCLPFSTFSFTLRLDLALVGVDVLVVRRWLHLGVAGACHNLRDLLLLLVELQLCQELGEHGADSVQCNV